MKRLSNDCLKDHKSIGPWKEQCLEDYPQRFGYIKSLCIHGTQIVEWWSEGALHAGVSGHHWVSSNWTRLAS